MTHTEAKRISPSAKWLAAGMVALMAAYGILIITTQHYVGHTSKLGGAEITADGKDAVLIGIAMIILGLTPMCLWAKSGKAAGVWAGSCMILGVMLFLAPLYTR